MFEEDCSLVGQEGHLFGIQLDCLVIVRVSFFEFLLFVSGVSTLFLGYRLQASLKVSLKKISEITAYHTTMAETAGFPRWSDTGCGSSANASH